MRNKLLAMILSIIFIIQITNNMLLGYAEEKCILRVPKEAKIYIDGSLIDEKLCVVQGELQGRIHELAAVQTGNVYQYKEYTINRNALEKVQVYDWMLRELSGQEKESGVFDYTLASDAFAQAVEDTVKEAAVSYYNRVAGLNSNFSQYYKQGSNAYEMILISDNATKWGRFIAPGKVTQVTCSDIFAYSDCAFSATATVDSDGGYAEHFEIHFLFQNEGEGWRVTDFTFMP